MKRLLLLFFLFPVLSFATVTKILFLGNSYTYTNDLPGTFYQFALAGGDTILVDSYCIGGYTFQNHSTDANSIAKIHSNQWDYVVLQEQSQTPAFPPSQVATDCFPYAHILDSLIQSNDSCSKTVFYMTWGRKYGDASNCASYPPICTFSGMQGRLRESYLQMGVDNHAIVAPAGEAFKYSMIADSTVNLYVSDNSHPSVYGTYLIASVFYGTIFKKTPIGISYLSSLTSSEASFLQNIAYHTVFDSTSVWMLDAYKPDAHFTDSLNGLDVLFNNTISNSASFHWDFGDGSTASNGNPHHSFSGPGDYSVTCIAEQHCQTDTFTQTVHVQVNGIAKTNNTNIVLYPSPAREECIIEGLANEGAYELEVKNILGECVYRESIEPCSSFIRLNVRSFAPGLFFVEIKTKHGSSFYRLMKS